MGDFEESRIMKILSGGGVSRKSLRLFSPRASNLSDCPMQTDQDTSPEFFAVTVNLNPYGFVNNRKWSLYKNDAQRSTLLRIEASLRRTYPNIELVELIFEVCPKLKNIHFHALYRMPLEIPPLYEQYFNDRVKKVSLLCTYKNVEIEPLWNYEGWIKYITKDINI